jgi:hypothetical protein
LATPSQAPPLQSTSPGWPLLDSPHSLPLLASRVKWLFLPVSSMFSPGPLHQALNSYSKPNFPQELNGHWLPTLHGKDGNPPPCPLCSSHPVLPCSSDMPCSDLPTWNADHPEVTMVISSLLFKSQPLVGPSLATSSKVYSFARDPHSLIFFFSDKTTVTSCGGSGELLLTEWVHFQPCRHGAITLHYLYLIACE